MEKQKNRDINSKDIGMEIKIDNKVTKRKRKKIKKKEERSMDFRKPVHQDGLSEPLTFKW
jgi:hypothetical protein